MCRWLIIYCLCFWIHAPNFDRTVSCNGHYIRVYCCEPVLYIFVIISCIVLYCIKLRGAAYMSVIVVGAYACIARDF